MPVVHAELKRIARRCLRAERKDHTLQATALVNEAYVRLVNVQEMNWQNRAHFLAMAARLMRLGIRDWEWTSGGARCGGSFTKRRRWRPPSVSRFCVTCAAMMPNCDGEIANDDVPFTQSSIAQLTIASPREPPVPPSRPRPFRIRHRVGDALRGCRTGTSRHCR